MFGRVIEQMMVLKGYMAAAAASAAVLSVLYRISLIGFGWNKKRIRVHGYFIGLSFRDQVRTSCFYLRLVMLLWSLITMNVTKSVYPVMLICFGITLGILGKSVRAMLEEAGNTVLLLGGMYAAGLLLTYMREIQFERNIFLVYILLSSFMVLYSLYFFLRDIKNVSRGKRGKEGFRDYEKLEDTEESAEGN